MLVVQLVFHPERHINGVSEQQEPDDGQRE